jgi:hypothetical protein
MIPALQKEATSLNHAFTLVSETYETLRMSHTGNVFQRGYVEVGNKRWKSLEDLRVEAITRCVATKATATSGSDGLRGRAD